jgi:hypothetical protein
VRPVRTTWMKIVYRGDGKEVGDLWSHREDGGTIVSLWKPEAGELELLNAGGAVALRIHHEPIPPVSMLVVDAELAEEIAEHTFRVPAELEDPERQ